GDFRRCTGRRERGPRFFSRGACSPVDSAGVETTKERERARPRPWRRPEPAVADAHVDSGEGGNMSGVRILVGTRKGGFVLTADGRRDRFEVSGPHFAGWEIFHMK